MQCTKPAQSPAQSPGAGVRGPCLPKGSHQGKKRGLVMEIFRKGAIPIHNFATHLVHMPSHAVKCVAPVP